MSRFIASIILVNSLISVCLATDPIEDVLSSNFGEKTGVFKAFDGSLGTCQFKIYKPEEFCTSCKEIYVESSVSLTPAIYLAAYPNNGLVFSWELNSKTNAIDIFRDEKKTQYTSFQFDPSTRKILSYQLSNLGTCTTSN